MWRYFSQQTYRPQTRQWESDHILNEIACSVSENRTGCLATAYKWVITELTCRGNRVNNIAELNITVRHYCSKAYNCVIIGLMFVILVAVNTQTGSVRINVT